MILATVRRTILERELLGRGDHVVVACSGGPDSVVLVHVLHRLRRELAITLAVASVDHGLRPEAVDEVAGVGRFADSLELPFRPLSVEVGAGASVQASARDARYAALFALAEREGASHLAVGHTRDDQAETVLSRLLRGAGLRGLAGVDARREDGVIRPLIDCDREDVRRHLAHHHLSAIVDPSNADSRFERVRIRHEILPALIAEDPKIISHLADLADEAREVERTLTRLAAHALEALGDAKRVGIDRLVDFERPVRRRLLRGWAERITGQHLGRAHVEDIERLVLHEGEVLLPREWTARRVGSEIHLNLEPGRRSRSV